MKKVVVVPTIRDWPWGAPGACMGALVEKMLALGHRVFWLVAPIDLDHPEVSRLAAKGAKVVRLPDRVPDYIRFPRVRRRIHEVLNGGPTLKALLADFSPDHVFVNQGGAWSALEDPDLWGVLNERRQCYSLIVHLNQPQHPFPPMRRAEARSLYSGAKRVFFNSNWVRKLSEFQICDAIPNAASFQPPVRLETVEPLAWPRHEVPRLAMVCRLDAYQKGIDLALEAVARLKAQGVALELGIYGEGPDAGYLNSLADFLDVADRVRFHGYKGNIRGIWEEEELLLMPSRFEGLGVSMLEAMSFGRPVLRTPHGGASEWIEDGVNGYLCAAAEAEPLYLSLVRALSDRPNWHGRGLSAHAKIRKDLDTDPATVFLSALSG